MTKGDDQRRRRFEPKPITYHHTSLAQDAFSLYHAVIDNVTEKIKKDLVGKNEYSETEIETISSTLKRQWKATVNDSGCFDHENLVGMGLLVAPKRRRVVETDKANPALVGLGVPSSAQLFNPYDNKIAPFMDQKSKASINEIRNVAPGGRARRNNTLPDLGMFAGLGKGSLTLPELPPEGDVLPIFSQENTGETKVVNGKVEKNPEDRDLMAPLCSDDDDSANEEEEPLDQLMAQYTRISRKKHEWSVGLKNGIMHINGKDYAFAKATGGIIKW